MIQHFLSDYGWMAMIALLLASGVGIPIGEELVNVPAGVFVGQGDMAALPTFLAAYAGVLEAKHQFDRRGAGVLVVARFIPGTRSPALTIAALMRMPWRKFTVVELICCAITTPLQVGIGILIGRGLAGQSLQTTIFTALGVIAGIVALTALVNWVVATRRRGEGPAPRARAEWLRQHRSDSTAELGSRRASCVRS